MKALQREGAMHMAMSICESPERTFRARRLFNAMAPCTKFRKRRTDATFAAPRATLGFSSFGTRPPLVTTQLWLTTWTGQVIILQLPAHALQ